MAYLVTLKRSAEKELSRLSNEIHDRIIERLITLQDDPRPQGTKKLRGREGYRLRVGDYRILYLVDDAEQKIEVYSVAHRREVYRR
jgi:mRNA interferase RelE/StbE